MDFECDACSKLLFSYTFDGIIVARLSSVLLFDSFFFHYKYTYNNKNI